MRPESELLSLIRAMNKQEKRYFKLYATAFVRKRGGNKLTELFDAYAALNADADEAEVVKRLSDAPTPRQLATARYELTNLILNSLATYNAGKSADAELRAMLAHIQILYNKGLYDHCRKVVSRARAKARELDYFSYMIEILAWERKLLLRQAGVHFEESLRRFHDEQLTLLEQIAATIRYEDLADRVQEAHRAYVRLKDASARIKLDEIVQSDLLNADPDGLPFHARLAMHQARGNYDWFVGNVSAAMNNYRLAIETWEAQPQHIRDDPDNFKRYLTNFLSCAIAIHEFDDFQQTLRKIKSLPSASVESDITVFGIVTYLELVFYLHNGQLEEARGVVKEFELAAPRYVGRLRPDRLINLYYNCSMIYFLSGDYGGALRHINDILNEHNAEPKRDIQDFTRIVRLVIHYELNDFDALENMFRSAQRYLNNRGQLNNFEKSVISAVRRLLNAADKTQRRAVISDLRTALLDMLQDDDGADPLGLIEILFWTESKLRKRPIDELFSRSIKANRGRNKRELFTNSLDAEANP